jgi:hypothetical protein
VGAKNLDKIVRAVEIPKAKVSKKDSSFPTIPEFFPATFRRFTNPFP